MQKHFQANPPSYLFFQANHQLGVQLKYSRERTVTFSLWGKKSDHVWLFWNPKTILFILLMIIYHSSLVEDRNHGGFPFFAGCQFSWCIYSKAYRVYIQDNSDQILVPLVCND